MPSFRAPVHPPRPRPPAPARAAAPIPPLLGALGVALLIWGAVVAGAGARARPALATVAHQLGFEATVLGWTSWYGGYDLGAIGTGWCIDHGSAAPDAAFDYRPANPTDLRDDTKAAMAWAVTTAGGDTDPVRVGRPDAGPARPARGRLPLRPPRRRHLDHRSAGRVRRPGSGRHRPGPGHQGRRPGPCRPAWPPAPRGGDRGHRSELGSGGGHVDRCRRRGRGRRVVDLGRRRCGPGGAVRAGSPAPTARSPRRSTCPPDGPPAPARLWSPSPPRWRRPTRRCRLGRHRPSPPSASSPRPG